MKSLIVFVCLLFSVFAFSADKLNGLKLVTKTEYYERYNFTSADFLKNKKFTYVDIIKPTSDTDEKATCYSLSIDNDLNYILKQGNNMEMKGKIKFESKKITLEGIATFVGGTKNTNPIILEIDNEYDVFTPGEKSPYFFNGNRSYSVSLKQREKGMFHTLVTDCTKDNICKRSCL